MFGFRKSSTTTKESNNVDSKLNDISGTVSREDSDILQDIRKRLSTDERNNSIDIDKNAQEGNRTVVNSSFPKSDSDSPDNKVQSTDVDSKYENKDLYNDDVDNDDDDDDDVDNDDDDDDDVDNDNDDEESIKTQNQAIIGRSPNTSYRMNTNLKRDYDVEYQDYGDQNQQSQNNVYGKSQNNSIIGSNYQNNPSYLAGNDRRMSPENRPIKQYKQEGYKSSNITQDMKRHTTAAIRGNVREDVKSMLKQFIDVKIESVVREEVRFWLQDFLPGMVEEITAQEIRGMISDVVEEDESERRYQK